MRYLVDGYVPIDSNWVENQIRPGPLEERTGFSQVHCVPISELRRS
jgi:hypothetical protein